MRHNKNRSSLSIWGSSRILWILVLFIVVAAAGMLISRELLLENARVMGKNLVVSYANDENSQLNEYDRILTMAMHYQEDMYDQGASAEEFEAWLGDFFEKSASLLSTSHTDIYAVWDDQVISASGVRDRDYSYRDQEWYKLAMEAGGRVIFTDAHLCGVCGSEQVITVAVSAAGSDNAVAFDVPLEHFRESHTVQDLPSGGAYYVLDSQGSLLYSNTPYFEATEEELQVYTKDLFDRVSRGELDGRNNEMVGMHGLTRRLY